VNAGGNRTRKGLCDSAAAPKKGPAQGGSCVPALQVARMEEPQGGQKVGGRETAQVQEEHVRDRRPSAGQERKPPRGRVWMASP